MMKQPLVNEWVEMIRPLFPKNARIEIDSGNDVVLRIDWKLENDPNRPNKRSRLIRVKITEEVIEDCTDSKIAGSRFMEIIRFHLSVFDPDHDTPRHGSLPEEKWVISTLDVN